VALGLITRTGLACMVAVMGDQTDHGRRCQLLEDVKAYAGLVTLPRVGG
jgi:hypothetical protein